MGKGAELGFAVGGHTPNCRAPHTPARARCPAQFFSGPASHGGSFTWEVQSLMAVVMVFSVAALALHHAISAQHNAHRAERRAARNAERAAQQQALSQAAAAAAARGDAPAAAAPALQLASASVDLPAAAQPQLPKDAASTRPKKSKQSMGEIYRTLASSVPIRCLVVMSMAQGLCTNLMEFAWKSHIRLLYPTPAEFTSFLGDVSTWQGIVTGGWGAGVGVVGLGGLGWAVRAAGAGGVGERNVGAIRRVGVGEGGGMRGQGATGVRASLGLPQHLETATSELVSPWTCRVCS